MTPEFSTFYVGDAVQNSFQLSFTQTEACGYPETVQIIEELPQFIVFN